MLTEDLAPAPTDAYGRSKLAAEQGLAELDLDWVALRLVLVYGTGVKGNMAQLVRFARSPYPLPLRLLEARRSLLSLDNLAAAVDAVLAAPGPLRRPLIVADREALTLPDTIGMHWGDAGSLRIGAFTTIAAIAADARLAAAYPGIAASAQGLATLARG